MKAFRLKNLLSSIAFGTNNIIYRFVDGEIYKGDVADLKDNILLMDNCVQMISIKDNSIVIRID